MQLSTGYEDRKPRIEIVPLIDVVFLLLVFFIYAMLSMTVHRGLKIDLPEGIATVEKQPPIVITISEDNTIWVDGRAMEMQEAVAAAAHMTAMPCVATDGEARAANPKPLIISGDKHAELGVGIELLAALRNAGVTSVSFQMAAPKE